MLVVLARLHEMSELQLQMWELKERQDILATALQIALEELEVLQKEQANDSERAGEGVGNQSEDVASVVTEDLPKPS